MSEWYSAQQLAGLPELPTTDRGVRILSEREGWQSRRKSSGKGFEYHFSSLPAAAQQALRRRKAIAVVNAMAAEENARIAEAEQLRAQRSIANFAAEQKRIAEEATRKRQRTKEDGLAKFNALEEGERKERAYARQWLVEASWQYFREHGGTEKGSRVEFADAVNTGTFAVPEKFAAFIPQYNGRRALTEGSLTRWNYALQNLGIWALVDQHGKRRGQSIIETTPRLRELVLGCMVTSPHINGDKVRQYLIAGHPDVTPPSARSIQRFIDGWIRENESTWLATVNPDKWKSKYMVALGSHHENIQRLNQLWEMDSTPADWMLADGRHSVVGAIDLYSRRLTFHVSKTSSAYAVCQTFRRAVLEWGTPECVRTDNGKDYVSKHFKGVLKQLEIEHDLCDPFASEQKGTIERAMCTMSHGILDLLPGFIGHNVAERKIIEARKSFADRIMSKGEVIEVAMTAADLQLALDQWTEYMYGRNVHSGLNGKTPWEVANAWAQPIRKIDNERALDALLEPIAGTRTIDAEGLRIDNYRYWSSEFIAQDAIGRTVTLKRVDHDLGRVHVFLDGVYLCVAECPELLGISRREFAVAAKHEQQKVLTENKRALQDSAQHVARNKAQVVLQHRIEQSSNVSELPKRSEEYSTPALDQAERSLPTLYLSKKSYDDDAEPITNNVVALAAPLSPHQQILERDDTREMYAHWCAMDERINQGEELPEDETRWHRMYPTSAAFRTGQKMVSQ